MFSTTDTIVAIATPPGRGGLGVVRLSGPESHSIARRLITHLHPLEPRHATLTKVRLKPDPTRNLESALSRTDPSTMESRSNSTGAIDEVVTTFFPAPHSYTAEDIVEISAHGSPVVLRSIVVAAMEAGARLAEPGEFTLRAYLNGRLDLVQAEAVADLIDAVTPLQARAAFDQLQGTLTRTISEIDAGLFDLIARLEASIDFPDEGYHFVDPSALGSAIQAIIVRISALLAEGRRGRLVREGLQVAIVGRPNVGKSSLFNALVGARRAIVTDVPGTTRDLVSETIDLDGLKVTLVDTAGLRETTDVVEIEGVERSRQAAQIADLVLLVLDRSIPLGDDLDDGSQGKVNKQLIVANKADIPGAWALPDAVEISTLTGVGFGELRARMASALDIELLADRPGITNARHIALAERAREALVRGHDGASRHGRPLPEEFVLADLQDARAALEEIVGRRSADDVLTHIFERFCIGK